MLVNIKNNTGAITLFEDNLYNLYNEAYNKFTGKSILNSLLSLNNKKSSADRFIEYNHSNFMCYVLPGIILSADLTVLMYVKMKNYSDGFSADNLIFVANISHMHLITGILYRFKKHSPYPLKFEYEKIKNSDFINNNEIMNYERFICNQIEEALYKHHPWDLKNLIEMFAVKEEVSEEQTKEKEVEVEQ